MWNPHKPSKVVRKALNLDINGKPNLEIEKRKSEDARKRGREILQQNQNVKNSRRKNEEGQVEL